MRIKVTFKRCPECRGARGWVYQDEHGWYGEKCLTCHGTGTVDPRIELDNNVTQRAS